MHVVSYNRDEEDAEGGPARRATRRSSRGRPTPQARGRRTVREGEEDLEEVQATSRRRSMRGASLQEEGDKISIEVGSVKALSTKYGIVRGMTWMVILSMLLWWVPVLGPATVGYVGGRKAGGPLRAAIAALVPLLFVFALVAVTTSSAENVPLAIQHYVSLGYQAVLGSLPFDFPLLAYIFSNLAAVMTSGPDALFTVLAFALVGGAVTQMRIHERSVPPITARLPKSRVVQGPAQTYENTNEAVETLVSRLSAVLDRAEGKRGYSGGAVADGGAAWAPKRHGWAGRFSRGRHPQPAAYPELKSTSGASSARAAPALVDSPTRQVVSSVLASTAPQAKGRVAKQAVRAARPVELDIPQTLALADKPGADPGLSSLGSAHVYRPSKMYHIYGGTVNPVARKKLEKRLRRTHTMHAMRRGARALVNPSETLARTETGDLPEIDDMVDVEDEKPRSLESSALGASMHYDALEHLQNATVAPLPPPAAKKPKPKAVKPAVNFEKDELGGLIAHLGEGGEAVVENNAVHDLDFDDGPKFDRKGRQRARIASDEEEPPAPAAEKPHATAHVKPKPAAQAPAVTAAPAHAPPATKTTGPTGHDKERLEKWLAHTLKDMPDGQGKPKGPKGWAAVISPAAPHAEPAGAPDDAAQVTVSEIGVPPEPAKPKKKAAAGPATPSRFEVTHGSVEADAEAESDDGDASSTQIGGVRHRTAAQILKEIRQQKKDDAARKEQAEAAQRALEAKAQADEIERRIRENATLTGEARPPEEGPGAAVAETEEPRAAEVPLQASPKEHRHRSDDLEAVLTTAEELSGELEMTLDPIREEAPATPEAHVAVEEITMLEPEVTHQAHAATGSLPATRRPTGEAVTEDAAPGTSTQEGTRQPEPERDVGPEDVVLAGPSTDGQASHPDESQLSAHDREKIKKRLEEGWNRM